VEKNVAVKLGWGVLGRTKLARFLSAPNDFVLQQLPNCQSAQLQRVTKILLSGGDIHNNFHRRLRV